MLAVTDDIGESRYGFICEEKHLKIVKSKKTRKKYIFAGIALIEVSLLDNYNKEVFSFEDFINDIRLEESHYDLHLFTEKFIDFGTPESYLNLKVLKLNSCKFIEYLILKYFNYLNCSAATYI